MSKPSPIEKIKEWFSKHGLEWNEGIESTLMEDGVKCVEDLKYLKKKEWDDLFASESKVIRRRAAHVYGDYLKGDPDPKQCASELGLKKHSKESKEAKEKPVSISKPGTIKAAKDNTLLLDAGFSRKVTQTGEEKSTEREKKRKAAALEAESAMLMMIVVLMSQMQPWVLRMMPKMKPTMRRPPDQHLAHLIGVLADVLCRRIWLIPLMITKSRRGTTIFYHFVCSPTKTAMI